MGSKNIYERFVWFDHRVRSGKYPNATSLSGQFEVSVKTAQRDIEFMRDRLNCPLLYEKSQKGYYYEDDTFSLPMVYLSSEELASLLIARKFLQDISGGYVGKEISAIIEKITTILKKHVAGLSPKLSQEIFQMIHAINKEGVTILLVEQNANMAFHLASRGHVLETGSIIFSGTGMELKDNPIVRTAYLGTGVHSS